MSPKTVRGAWGGTRQRIVDARNDALIVHRMSNPEPLAAGAGTVWHNITSVTQPARQPGLIAGILFNEKPEMPPAYDEAPGVPPHRSQRSALLTAGRSLRYRRGPGPAHPSRPSRHHRRETRYPLRG